MKRLVLATFALAALWVSACGSDDPSAVGGSTSAAEEQPPAGSPVEPEELYEADAIVLEADDGPMLCLGAMLTSLPPQCGDVPITNWDWHAVEGERSLSGTTWGGYHVVGTFDGESFTVSEIGPFDRIAEPEAPSYESPCPEPPGGWPVSDAEHNTQDETRGAHAYARHQPDYVISWNDHLDDALQEFSPVLLVAVFTGDSARHEAEIRKLWNGPLCVVERELPTARQLARIRKDVEARLPELGLRLLMSYTDGFPPAIYIDVVADVDGRAQALFDDEYGPGIVHISSALRPAARTRGGCPRPSFLLLRVAAATDPPNRRRYRPSATRAPDPLGRAGSSRSSRAGTSRRC
jgi:hypothetical protein